MTDIERLGGIGYPRPEMVLPDVLKRNYGRWARHEFLRPGVLKHVSESGEECLTLRILMPMGKRISATTLREVCDLADRYAGGLRVTSRRALEIIGVRKEMLDEIVAGIEAIGLKIGGTGRTLHQIVTCTAFTHCQQAAIDGPSIAHALGNTFFEDAVRERYPTKLAISVSGCPNQCGQANTADIGIVGIYQDIPVVHDEKMETCDAPLIARTCPTHAIRVVDQGRTVRINEEQCVYCGSCALQCGAIEFGRPGTARAAVSMGGKGSNTGYGPTLGKIVAVGLAVEPPYYEAIVDVVRRIIDAWVATARPGERVRDWVQRIGWEKFYQRTALMMPRQALDSFRQNVTTLRTDVRFRW